MPFQRAPAARRWSQAFRRERAALACRALCPPPRLPSAFLSVTDPPASLRLASKLAPIHRLKTKVSDVVKSYQGHRNRYLEPGLSAQTDALLRDLVTWDLVVRGAGDDAQSWRLSS